MKLPTPFRLVCALLLAGSGLAPAAEFPAEELAKLPYLTFGSNNLGEANIYRMRRGETTITIGNHPHIGFRFWSTGLVDWLLITTDDDLQPATWILVDDQGQLVDTIEPTDIPLDDCPRVTARYPDARRVTYYQTKGEALERRGRYHLMQQTGSPRPGRYALSFRSCSPGSYEAGKSGDLLKNGPGPAVRISVAGSNREKQPDLPPLRETSDMVIEHMKELRREQGMEAAAAYLAREMHLRLNDQENPSDLPAPHQREARWGYLGLYINAWAEAQTGGGRLDADWAAAVYGAMYDVCIDRGYFARTDVALNLTNSLMLAGRYGKLTDVLEVWKEGIRLGGYHETAASYPDDGLAFDILPQVRKRRIPARPPYADAKGRVPVFQDKPHALTNNFLGCFEKYATHLWFQGKWRESLEWLAWANSRAAEPGTNDPKRSSGGRWHISLSEIADQFTSFGFHDQALALHEHALGQKITGGYEGKCTTRHRMSILHLKRMTGHDLPADAIEQARDCITHARGNLYEKQEFVERYEAELGALLIHLGHLAEGETLLDRLAAAGSRDARIARLTHWVNSRRSTGVENELLQLLRQSRETGRKMDEIVFYRLYADFLEQQGRLGEALQIRRELVRLCQAFDIFTHLPVELARLATLLHRLGMNAEGRTTANHAHELLQRGGLPGQLADTAFAILKGIGEPDHPTPPKTAVAAVEFQPREALVIPLAGTRWVSHFTLTNPSDTAHTGTLAASGLPVTFQQTGPEVDILATIGGREGTTELPVEIAPGTFKLIALDAAAGTDPTGKLTLTWTVPPGGERTASSVRIEPATAGTTRAIIQAGAYQMNPFYGIPAYHHYVDTTAPEHSAPMRFVASQPARIEVYGLDDSPVAIDAQANGSLLDPGDELFGSGDGQGNLLLPLANGTSSFMIAIYPHGALPADGLGLRIEVLDGDHWQLYAEDRLMPAQADE